MKNILLFLLLITYNSHSGADEVAELLSQYQWSQRVLLVFSSVLDNVNLVQQRQLLAGQDDPLQERDLLVIQVIPGHAVFINGEKTDYQPAQFMKHFMVDKLGFYVVLIGKDGGKKLETTSVLEIQRIYDTIDAMPMRQREMRNE